MWSSPLLSLHAKDMDSSAFLPLLRSAVAPVPSAFLSAPPLRTVGGASSTAPLLCVLRFRSAHFGLLPFNCGGFSPCPPALLFLFRLRYRFALNKGEGWRNARGASLLPSFLGGASSAPAGAGCFRAPRRCAPRSSSLRFAPLPLPAVLRGR